jgi:hypothetical protein
MPAWLYDDDEVAFHPKLTSADELRRFGQTIRSPDHSDGKDRSVIGDALAAPGAIIAASDVCQSHKSIRQIARGKS